MYLCLKAKKDKLEINGHSFQKIQSASGCSSEFIIGQEFSEIISNHKRGKIRESRESAEFLSI